MITPGKYTHYKGHDYEVLFVGKHSDTLEEYVVYRGLYNSEEFGNNPVWVRPLKAFTETVTVDGKDVPRFRFIG